MTLEQLRDEITQLIESHPELADQKIWVDTGDSLGDWSYPSGFHIDSVGDVILDMEMI